MSLAESFPRPVKWLVAGGDVHRFHENVHIEERQQRDGSFLYAITRMGDVMARDGEWEYEPQPSSRDDDFISRTRYTSFEVALAHFLVHHAPVGATSSRERTE